MPFFLFGIYEKDGQPLEKVLKNIINARILRPPERPYQTNNGYAALMRQENMRKEAITIEKRKTGIHQETDRKSSNSSQEHHPSKER